MSIRNFFRPTKIKIGLFALLFLLAFVGMFGVTSTNTYGRIRNTPAADIFFNAISLPSSIYETLVQVKYGEVCSPGINGEPEYCEQGISFVGVLPNPMAAVAITWIAMAIYWYFLACIIVWLFSLRKKQSSQTPDRQSPDGSGGPL